MAKAYWIGRIDVEDAETYKGYVARNPAIFAKFGGRFIVRGGTFETVEGTSRARNVVVEFPDYAAAKACFASAEYQANALLRKKSSVADVIIVEGYDEPQA